MAMCETCSNAVLNDGQRCAECLARGRMRELPRGFVAFGWYTGGQSLRPRTANMGVRESVVHLAPDEQTAPGASGRARKPYMGVCGKRCEARGATVEFPDQVAQEAMRGERKWCQRCFLTVASREHLPEYRSHRTGVGNRYGRGASGSGNVNTHVTCSCGWKNGSNTTKREQMRNFREHLLDVVKDGMFVIERERYEPVIGGLWSAAAALNPYGQADEESRRQLAGLVMGESMGAPTKQGYVVVKRKLPPLIPAAAR